MPTVSGEAPTAMKSESSESEELESLAGPEEVGSVLSSVGFVGLSVSIVSRSSRPWTSIRRRELSPGFLRRLATEERVV